MSHAKKQIIGLLAKATKLSEKEIEPLIEIPPAPEMGDYAFPCFSLSKIFKKDPKQISLDLEKKIKPEGMIAKVKSTGPYLNFFLDESKLAKEVLSDIWKKKNKFGAGETRREKVMVEGFGGPNTHKAFHVGHLRNVCLSEAVSNLLESSGYKVVRANYYGDVGAHIARWIWFYNKFHKGSIPKENIGKWFAEIYSKSTKYLAEHPDAEEQVSALLKALEEGEPKLTKIWRQTKELSLNEFRRLYKILGVEFDSEFFESELEKPGKDIVSDLLKKGIAEKSEGAIIVDLKKYGLDVFLVLRTDGTALYSTKDLALAKVKFDKYKIDKSFYVIDVRQSLYMKQLFKTLELMGFKQAKNCHHLAYGFVTVKGEIVAARTGEQVLFEDIYNVIKKRAVEEIKKRDNVSKKQADEIAHKITIAAIKYGMLKFSSESNIDFDWEKALQFEGDTGPYLQYALVRANKIIKKSGLKPSFNVDFTLLVEPEEKALIKAIAQFPEMVLKSADSYSPHVIANYCYELSTIFSSFYEKHSVINAEGKIRKARLLLVWAFAQTLKNALRLLGIEEVELM